MRWLITGASGALGSYILRELDGESVVAWSGTNRASPFVPVNLADPDVIATTFRATNPDIIIHAGAMARVDSCRQNPDLAHRINTVGTTRLCDLAGQTRLVYVSTDLVFDGEHAPYRETDAPAPLSTYGRTKKKAESPVQQLPNGVVARLSLLFGSSPQPTFFAHLQNALNSSQPTTLFIDEWRTPLGLATAAKMLIAVARSEITGTVHLGGPERMNRYEMGQRLARYLKLSDANLIPGERNAVASAETRPRDVSLDISLLRKRFPFIAHPSFEESLSDMLNEKRGALLADSNDEFLLAVQHHRTGDLTKAEQHYRHVLADQPNHAAAASNLGVILSGRGNLLQAEKLYKRALTVEPNFGDAHLNLGNLYTRLNKVNEAIECFKAALQSTQSPVMARQNLWQLYFATGRVAEAVDHLTEYTRSYPEDAEAWHLLGLARIRLGKNAEAMTALRQAIGLNPGHVLAHNSLGIALEETGDQDAASASFEHAIRIGPNRPEAYNNLALNRLEQGRAPEAVGLFRQSLAIDRRQMHIFSNYLLALNYLSDLPPQTLLTEHTNWAAHFAQPERPPARVHRPNAGGILHVGYVSPDFRSHPVAPYIGAVLGAHDRKAVKVTCYSSVVMSDETTARLRSLSDYWRDIVNMNDAQAADLIRRDKVDVLVDLSGHSSRHRLGIFARRAAPIQVTSFGYPNTTGVPTMDYRLTDSIANPEGSDSWYVEKLVRLAEVAWCWKPPEIAPPVGPLPADTAGFITFGSLNNTAKLTAEAIALWARLVANVPGSKLVVLASKSRSAQERILAEFAKHGAEGRVEALPRMTPAEYYAAYNRIDIALDPFPYNGGVTTCDALWMGVPVVSLIGSNYAGRQGLSILTAIGLPELAAANDEENVAVAQKLANDRNRLRETRAGLRERMQASPVCDTARFVKGLEEAYRGMVKGA